MLPIKTFIKRHQKTIKVCLVLSCFIALPLACKKKPKPTFCEQNPDQCAPISEAKDFFLFKKGTWWVYEEQTSKVRDSLYVITSADDPSTYNFNVEYFSDLTRFTYHYFPGVFNGKSSNPSYLADEKTLFIKRSKYGDSSTDFLDESVCFYLYYPKGSYTYNGRVMSKCEKSVMKIEDILPKYELSNFLFGKTVVVSEECNYSEGQQPTKHFYCKGVGLVRKELIDSNQVWNLVNYHIEE